MFGNAAGLHRPERIVLVAELALGVNWPIGIVEGAAGEGDEVGIAVDEDFVGRLDIADF